MRWLLLCYFLKELLKVPGYKMQKTWCCTEFWAKVLKVQLEMEHATHLLASLSNPPPIFTAVVLFAWSCSKWNYSFLIPFWLPFTYLWANLWTLLDNLSAIQNIWALFLNHNGSCWSQCQSSACFTCPAPGTRLGQPGEPHLVPVHREPLAGACPLLWGLPWGGTAQA